MESNPVPLQDLYFDAFSYPVASIVFGDFFYCFLANPRYCLERYRLVEWRHLIANSPRIILVSFLIKAKVKRERVVRYAVRLKES